MENYKNRTSFSKYNLEGKHLKGPFYQEIENFIVESRKCQTLYANCEGSYGRRVLNLKHKNTLENFVYYTTYCNGSQTWDNEQDFSKREHVEKITYAMIKISKAFQVEEEIHFGVVWIYYFCYEGKTQKATPLFKIYKSKTENEAVFLDTSLALYNSWNCYLDASLSEFPVSFFCLPRNGDYHFLSSDGRNTKELDLEFVCSKKLTSMTASKKSRFEGLSSAKYTPFCQIAVRPWLVKIRELGADVIRKLKVILSNLWTYLSKAKKQCLNVVVFGILFWFHMKEKNISFVDALKMMATDSLMLLNTVSTEDGSLENCLSRAFLSSITTSIPGFSNFHNSKQSLTKFQRDGKSLIELLKNPIKSWYDILRIFCDLYHKSKSIIVAISLVVPLPPILNSLFLLLDVSSHILEFFLMRNIESSKTDKAQEMKGMTLFSAADISDSKLSVKPTGSFQSPECERETPKYLEDVESERINLALENVFTNLPRLETIFSKISKEEFFEESLSMYERHREFSTSDSSQILTRFLFLGEKDGYGFFFIPHASLPRLTNTIGQLIEGHFIFEPKEINICKVVCKPWHTVGHLFFPKEYCAIAFLSLVAINKQTQTLLESESAFNSI